MTTRQQKIVDYIQQHGTVKSGELQQYFWIERTVLYRDLQKLIKLWVIVSMSKWSYSYRESAKKYLEIPYFSRPEKKYTPNFLKSYSPNETYFLSKQQRNILYKATEYLHISTDHYKTNKRIVENALIDLSYSSSNLEGNTYSYLDTEVLVKYHEVAKNQSKEDTKMILNHKEAIEYLLHYKHELEYRPKTFFEIHILLGRELLKAEELWVIRNGLVKIGWSSYTPIDNNYELEEEFTLFLDKLNNIQDPFEQSIFILVFIPYFQLFRDINKRTSRILCNLPLLKHNLPLLSLLQVQSRTYIDAILAIYELHDVRLMADLYTDNYILNMDRYVPGRVR